MDLYGLWLKKTIFTLYGYMVFVVIWLYGFMIITTNYIINKVWY